MERPGQQREYGKKSGGAPGAADWNIRGRSASGLERPGTKRTGNGRSGAANKEKETAAERQGEKSKNKSKEQKGEDKKERRCEAGGERARGGKQGEKEKKGRRMGTWSPDRNGPERRGHDGGKERQEQGEVGREDKEDKSQGKEEKERPKERTNTDGDSSATARGATRTSRRRQEKAGGQSRRACTRTSEDEGG